MKIKHYILFVCLFAVIATKTYVILCTLFSDFEIELSNEFDEEDSDSEEDTEKETSEKDICIYQFSDNNFDFFKKINNQKNNYLYFSTAYSSPYLDNTFCPPDFIS